jgi:ABC-2 type transport system ATP-binding protein
MTVLIEARALTKSYEDGVVRLDHLDLTVAAGEIYCLLGANGAGKTTAINLFLDVIAPTSGGAYIHGVNVHDNPLEAKRWVGYLSENVMLYPTLTARQNLDFFARLARKYPGRSDLYRILSEVGLPEKSHEQKVKAFSKGMRQKLGIAIAMVKEAPALILDEPMSGLDPQAAAEFVRSLKELRDSGRALLMSTHDIFRAKELAGRVGIMKAGCKVAELTADELAHRDLEKIYLETMQEPTPPDASQTDAG